MAIKYAELERRLGEIDRARAIYVHTSQYCDPRTDETFWPLWHNFEVPKPPTNAITVCTHALRPEIRYDTEIKTPTGKCCA